MIIVMVVMGEWSSRRLRAKGAGEASATAEPS
jgi:hypothetical protein